MKLTDKLETLLACLPESPFKQHLREEIEAIESTVRQQNAELVRELVEALACCRDMVGHPDNLAFIDRHITHAQQWLESGEPATCKWTCDADMDAWESACGEAWQFMDDGPAENNVRFCQGCGKPVEITPPAPTGGEN